MARHYFVACFYFFDHAGFAIGERHARTGNKTLIVVAHGKHGIRRTSRMCPKTRSSQQFQPFVLKHVGVLKLIDEDVFEARRIVFAQQFVLQQQLVSAQQQLGEIDHAFALALGVIRGIKLDALLAELVICLDLRGAQAGVFVAVDEIHHVFRRMLFSIDVERFEQALDG